MAAPQTEEKELNGTVFTCPFKEGKNLMEAVSGHLFQEPNISETYDTLQILKYHYTYIMEN